MASGPACQIIFFPDRGSTKTMPTFENALSVPISRTPSVGMALYARKMGMADPKSRTATGIVMGALGYMSPELEARLRADGASDSDLCLGDVLAQGLAWEKEKRFTSTAVMHDAMLPAIEAWEGRSGP